MIYNRILNCHLNTSNDPTLLSHHNQKIWKLLVFMPQTQKGPRHEKMNLQQKRKGLYICKCFSNELNLDHIQQYLDETVKISFDNNKPLMSKEGRHFFVRSTISEDISKWNQDLCDFLQKNFEKPDLKLKWVISDNSQVSTAYSNK